MEFECITENIAAMNIYRSLNFNEKKIKKVKYKWQYF